jgi:ribonuclease HII
MSLALSMEQELFTRGSMVVAGVDEAGRGAWAGPLVAAAVNIERSALNAWQGFEWFGQVADSKVLSPKTREVIFLSIKHLVPWSIGVVSNKIIDNIGIGEANRRAVNLAVAKLQTKPSYVLVDYVAKLGHQVAGIDAQIIVDGDATVFSIALASIVAKVQRDWAMRRYEVLYPRYGFGQHKGYGTAVHQAALEMYGPSPIHRRSYRPVQAHLV